MKTMQNSGLGTLNAESVALKALYFGFKFKKYPIQIFRENREKEPKMSSWRASTLLLFSENLNFPKTFPLYIFAILEKPHKIEKLDRVI